MAICRVVFEYVLCAGGGGGCCCVDCNVERIPNTIYLFFYIQKFQFIFRHFTHFDGAYAFI